jgi:c-di-GMP-binding flagellar brake protein YcgR
MLEKIKSLFVKPKAVAAEVDSEELSTQENPNFITEPLKIVKLLNEIEGSSPLCGVQIEGYSREFSSSILGVKDDKHLIMLDELVPRDGNILLQNHKAAKVLVLHKGIHLAFNVTEIEIGFSRGITYYKCKLPDRIYYPQRRRAHRIDVGSLHIPFSGIADKTRSSISGYLFDLSRSGIGIQLPSNRARLQRGDTIHGCQISFDDYVMDFDLSVRFVKPGQTGSSKMLIGGLFENMSTRSETKLSYFITSLERVEIRKQKH